MSANFFATPRGCVIQLSTAKGGGAAGGYALAGFPKGSPEAPIVLKNCNFTDQDMVLPVSTLSSEKILYTFGQDFGQVQIMGTVFLGPAGSSGSGLGPVEAYFNKNRVDVSRKPVNFSMPGNVGYSIFITSLAISQADPEVNSHDFAIGAIVAETTS